MCHEYTARDWDREPAKEPDEEDEPEFLNDEGGDVEVLTDGGE